MPEQQSLYKQQSAELVYSKAISLLKLLIATPSFSKEEDKTADIVQEFLHNNSVVTQRHLNNVWCTNKHFEENKPTILLNSHHDTVKPNSGYTVDPFLPNEAEGKQYGLGSNDAGGCLVSLIAAFMHFYNEPSLKQNIVLVASGEEEISGPDGIEALLKHEPFMHLSKTTDGKPLYHDWCGIVGEPTQMQMAVAEKGLMVLDCEAKGMAGHAARDEGENALYKAMEDIAWIKQYRFTKNSNLLGPVKMSVTIISTDNKAHNVVPASCKFIVDVRVNELYTFEDILDEIRPHLKSEIRPRSTRLKSTSIALDHPLVQSGLKLSRQYYGSPTTSDKALLSFPALKIGPGNSARSHSADEFIYLKEIKEGIQLFISLLENVLL